MTSTASSLVCTIVGIALVVGVIALTIIDRRREQQALLQSGIIEIDQMPGTTFERYLVALFRHLGYPVEHTGRVGDYGADLVIVRAGIRTIVQAKRWSRTVGVRAVQEAVAAKGMYQCADAMVVTNSVFTAQAKALARANDVELWDRAQLIQMLQLLAAPETPLAQPVATPASVTAAAPAVAPLPVTAPGFRLACCVVCGKPVSEKVRQYCEANRGRFNGEIYCYDHQRRPAH